MRLYSAVGHRVFGLDLMRAVAILAVLYAHTRHLVADLGFAPLMLFDGVDMFFVLSGFLIGGILLRSIREHGTTVRSILSFWRRRWLRTLPNYYLFLAVNLAVAYLAFPFAWQSFDASFLVFTQNLVPFAANHAFFPEAWSLAVEEWFYLSTPLLLLLLTRVLPARHVGAAAGITGALVIVASTWGRATAFEPTMLASFQEQDENIRKVVTMRLDSPAIGLMGALAKDRLPAWWRRGRVPLLLAGLALVGVAMRWQLHVWSSAVTWSFSTFHPTVLSGGFLLCLPALDGWKSATGPLARFVTHTSLVSYSLYLVHYSVLVALAQRFLAPQGRSGAVLVFLGLWAAAYALATLNYWLFESRVLAFRDGPRSAAPWAPPASRVEIP